MSYTVPQLLVSQEFNQLSTFTQSPLSPLIIGPDLRKGAITSVGNPASAGSNYLNPIVTVTDSGGTGTGAQVVAVQTDGPVGALKTIALGTAGTGYTVAPIVNISDTTGYGAVVTATVSGGAITGYTIVSKGINYSAGVSITVTRAAGDTTGAGGVPGAVVRSTGKIDSFTVVNGGSGYTSPVITVADTGIGSGCVAGSAMITASYALNTGLSNTIGSVNSVADIVTAFGTATDPNSTLAYGLYNAVLNSNGTTVFYCAIPTNDLAGYNTALSLAEKSNIYYGIVPLANDAEVTGLSAAVIGHVNNMSNPAKAKWRVCWLSPEYTDVTSYIGALQTGVQNANENSGPRRIHNVFPDNYYVDPTTQVKGYFLAAALAAIRAGSVPHQSLTNTQVVGPYYLDKCVVTLTEAQLNTLAGAGTWIVTQNAKGGMAYTRHQVTGDSSNLNYREDSVTANVDSISYGLQAALAPFVGVYNITPASLLKVRAAIDAELSSRLTNTFTSRAGNQLLGYKIISVTQDVASQDKVNVVIQIQVPYPMNYITVNLSI